MLSLFILAAPLTVLTPVGLPVDFISGAPTATADPQADGAAFFAPFAERADPPPAPPELSKKEAWLAEKARRLDVKVSDAALARSQRERRLQRAPSVAIKGAEAGEAAEIRLPAGRRVEPLTTLYNLHTREALPLVPGHAVHDRFHNFLRDYTTNQATRMDARLIGVLERVALRFSPERIEVVSGYRSPKYNLMLRKKGREVAKTSKHSEGDAVDFRVRGVPTRRLLNFVKSLRLGGVGYYPHSQFVHCDTGKIRFWRGS